MTYQECRLEWPKNHLMKHIVKFFGLLHERYFEMPICWVFVTLIGNNDDINTYISDNNDDAVVVRWSNNMTAIQ